MPGLQFHRLQHPVLRFEISSCETEWQVCALVKGRAGTPIAASNWFRGPGKTVELDLDQALEGGEFLNRYPEMHIVLGTWREDPEPCRVVFAASLKSRETVCGCMPVVRKSGRPVPLSAVVIDRHGNVPDDDSVEVTARIGDKTVRMRKSGNAWIAGFPCLAPGEYTCIMESSGQVNGRDAVPVRSVPETFLKYNASLRSLEHQGRPTGPLTGSFQGFVFFTGAGTDNEKIINGMHEWKAWDRQSPPGEGWHYWESLKEQELEQRLGYLRKCGWDVIHLCQGWGIWEKLDAGGRIAPHGAEQLALVYRIAARHNIHILQALSHYPYGEEETVWTPVYRQYLEKGYRESDWTDPDSEFTAHFHAYLRHFALLFSQEPALMAVTTSGEGDIKAGPARVNRTCEFMKEHLPEHIFAAEPIHRLKELPGRHCTDWKGEMYGSRLYWIGEKIAPELDMAVEMKFLAMGSFFVGEGSWPCHHLYANFMGYDNTWAGTHCYRLRLRDTLYMGLTHAIPLIMTWEEQYAEDEHLVFSIVRNRVDWSEQFNPGSLPIVVDGRNTGGGGSAKDMPCRETLAAYEEAFSRIPVDSRYVVSEPPGCGGGPVFDARKPKTFEQVREEIAAVRDQLEQRSPFRVVEQPYRCSFMISRNGNTVIAYLYNSAGYSTADKNANNPPLAGNVFRQPAPGNLVLRFDTPGSMKGKYELFDLDTRTTAGVFDTFRDDSIAIHGTSHDYLLVSPCHLSS